jgi:hypothetical protein
MLVENISVTTNCTGRRNKRGRAASLSTVRSSKCRVSLVILQDIRRPTVQEFLFNENINKKLRFEVPSS